MGLFSRLQKIAKRANLGLAYRYSCMKEGPIAGLFFFLGTICQLPLKNVLGGVPAVFLTTLSGFYAFFTKARENYRLTDPYIAGTIQDIQTANTKNSMYYILTKLGTDINKGKHYLESHQHEGNLLNIFNNCASAHKAEIKSISRAVVIDEFDQESPIEAYKLFYAIYMELQNVPFIKLQTLTSSFICCISEIAGNYLASMLAKTYCDYDPFIIEEGTSIRNILFLTVTATALYSGKKTFFENLSANEKPSLELLTNTILMDFSNQEIPHENSTESSPLIGINYGR